MYFNGRFVVNLAQFAAKQGADMHELLALSGLSYDELCKEECKLDSEVYNRIVEAAVGVTGDVYFGLHAGENLNLAAAGLIVQIAHTSETVKQALDYCCEFANLGCSALPLHLKKENDEYVLMLTPDPVWSRQSSLSVEHTVYGYLAFTIREFQSITRNKHHPKEIWVTWSSPGNTAELTRVLGCPVKFNKPHIAIFFHEEHIEQEVITSDYALLQILVSHAHQKMESMNVGVGFYDVVKRSIITLVKPDFPTIEQVAAHLNMSVRTFQRKLKADGFSYKEVIDQLRKEFALEYIQKPELSVSEIAYLLNYSDVSSFARSFKRWTGKTPGAYRK